MSAHGRYKYSDLGEIQRDAEGMGLDIGFSADVSVLSTPVKVGRLEAPNRLGIHPMEGCDGTASGSPGELTIRRYTRFAEGGAGLLWFEATAVAEEGRANPRQLAIRPDNLGDFRNMLNIARQARKKTYPGQEDALEVIQLTHSGRYSKPVGPRPIIAFHDKYLDVPLKLPEDYPLITDGEIERLEDSFAEAAGLAMSAGFRAVDVKSCHRYLPSELLAAHTRDGKYGGPYENRTRFIKNVVGKIKARYGTELEVVTRLNAFDGIPYPFGWGMSESGDLEPDLDEPLRLVGELAELGVSMINVTVGNPYYNPHFGRPYDLGPYVPMEHSLVGIERMFRIAGEIQKKAPGIAVMGTGYSWLRQFAPNAAAANISGDLCRIAGFGRQAFAYPDFARDILDKGCMDSKKVCIACSRCTYIMRDGGMAGCVPFDSEVYGPIYRRGREGKPPLNPGSDPTWHI